MASMFAPAIGLMNRLRYPKKFAVLGLVAFIAILVLQVILHREMIKVIEPSESELVGIAMLKPLNRMVQAMQQHRGLSSGVLNGNEALKDKRAAKEKDVDSELAATQALLPKAVADSTGWKNLLDAWAALKRDGMGMAAAENVSRHTAMIDAALTTMVAVADETALTLDPDMDSYYLMDAVVVKMPGVLERLGQLRARGTGILSKKEISEQQKIEVGAMLGEMRGTQRQQRQSIDKVLTYAVDTRSRLEKPMADFDTAVAGVVALINKEVLGGGFGIDGQEYFKTATTVIDQGYTAIYDIMLPTLTTLVETRIASTRNRLNATFVVTLVVTLLFAYLAMGAYLSMVDSVRALGDGAEAMAAGDLTGRVDCPSNDELRDVAGHFNHMAENMQSLLRVVQDTAQQLGAAAATVAASSSQVVHGSNEQSAAAAAMAAAVEELTVGIGQISDHAAAAQRVSDRSGELSLEGGRVVEATSLEMEKIASNVNQSAAIIGELGEHSESISTIVNVIKEIADQTNLLALNAAIEAARAGEQGRGFAVVADEVRKLAERTTKSTQEITEMIEVIQRGTTNAVTTMRDGVARVSDGVALSRRAGEAIGQISSGAEDVRGDVEEIAVALKEASSSSTEIARNVERIAQMVQANSDAVTSTAVTVSELERLSRELQTEVRHFRV